MNEVIGGRVPRGNGSALKQHAGELWDVLKKNKDDHDLSGGHRLRAGVLKEIHRLRPLVEMNAPEVGYRADPPRISGVSGDWPYGDYANWLNQLIGYLQALDVEETTRPRLQFADQESGHLSRQVYRQITDGDYGAAVLSAAAEFEAALQQRSGLTTGTTQLVSNALGGVGEAEHQISISCGGNADEEQGYREGIKLIGLGAMKAFRNPQAHGAAIPLTRDDCIQQCLMFAYLQRIVLRGGSEAVCHRTHAAENGAA